MTAARRHNRKAGPDPDRLRYDFASTGVGLGMADVAMHLVHALVPADLDGGCEEALIDGYLAALAEARGQPSGRVKLSPYPGGWRLATFASPLATTVDSLWAASGLPPRPSASRRRRRARTSSSIANCADLASALRFVERIST